MIWKRARVSETLHLSPSTPHASENHTTEWRLGEALTNLYVGLGRYHRGEKLSAMRFIQGYAVDRILELAAKIEPEASAARDPFALERRYEKRYPRLAERLPTFTQGYDRSLESAQAIPAFLESHFEVNPAMRQAIRELCDLNVG